MVPIATRVNRPAEMRPILSPKFKRPTARPPRMTVKFSHERNVPDCFFVWLVFLFFLFLFTFTVFFVFLIF